MNTIKQNYLRGLNIENEYIGVIPSVSGDINPGCHLYIGKSSTTSDITVKNLSGDEVVFYNPIQGSIIPFVVTEIIARNSIDSIVALW